MAAVPFVQEKDIMAHASATSTTPISADMQKCIAVCVECARSCAETITHCLQMGGKHADARHITLLRDCAVICETSARFMLHGSTFHGQTCAVCAEVCDACAKSCEALGGEEMKACADACRRCAESCRRMARA
jgi:hypothetical protein